MEDMKRGE